MDEPVLVEEEKNTALWWRKAKTYFFVAEGVFSVIGTLMLALGGNGGWINLWGGILLVAALGATPIALISLGVALIGAEKNNSKNKMPTVLIIVGILAFIPGCAIMSFFTFISA